MFLLHRASFHRTHATHTNFHPSLGQCWGGFLYPETIVNVWELAARKFTRAPQHSTPGELAKELDPTTVQTPALELIDEHLVRAYNTPDYRLIISMPPQEGKSIRASNVFPVWALSQNKNLRIVIASYQAGIARRFGRETRDTITNNKHKLGMSVRNDVSAQGEWMLEDAKGGVFTAGVGGALTSRSADLMIIDDPVKGWEQADSKTFRDKTWEWWQSTAQTRLSPGASVILILTRWHEDDLAGRLMKNSADWVYLSIPAEADHDPAKGETDPLGREPGEFMISARGRTQGQWEQRKRNTDPRTWASLYQGQPSPVEGSVFPKEWARYTEPLWIERPDGSRVIPGIERDDHELVQSWDFTFKDSSGSDYVVGQVWLRVNQTIFLLDMVRARLSFSDSVDAIKQLSARWPHAIAKFVEDKANGPAIINHLRRELPGLIPVEPEGSKYARATAISPFAIARNIILPSPELLPNVGELLEEAKNFPNSTHDDTIDALSQAANRLLLMPLLTEQTQDFTVDSEADLRGWSISPY